MKRSFIKHLYRELYRKTIEFILYDQRKTKALLSLLISDQIRLKQACVDKIHAWIEICEFGTRTKQFIYYMTTPSPLPSKKEKKQKLISLLISNQVRLKQACTDASLARDMWVRL